MLENQQGKLVNVMDILFLESTVSTSRNTMEYLDRFLA